MAITVCMPLAVIVPPASVKALAPLGPHDGYLVVRGTRQPLHEHFLGMRGRSARGKHDRNEVRLAGRAIDLDRVGRGERGSGKDCLGDVVEDLHLAADERSSLRCRPDSR